MLNAHFSRLNTWTGPRTEIRKDGVFRSTWVQTLDLLEQELGKLRAKDVVIQIEDPEGIKGIRNDGSYRMLSQHFVPSKPGVILTFESPKGSISMPCDRYRDWKDNLRAIALSLEALRAVDRYGVTRGNEQYRGWARLPAANANGKMDRHHVLAFLAAISGLSSAALDRHTKEMLKEILRNQRIAHHPDRATDTVDQSRRTELQMKIAEAEAVLCGEAGK